MTTIPNQTFVGLALYDPCSGSVGSVSNDCSSFSPSAAMGVTSVPGGLPSAVMLVGTNGLPIIRDSDQVNIYDGNCGTPRILGNAGMLVQWVAVADGTQPPQWTVYIEAGAPAGTPISPMQPVVLRNNNTGYMAAVASSGQIILASVPRSATCSSGVYGQPQATNAAYFVFTTASDAITTAWTLPTWVPSFFPYWWQSIDNWWPRWWSPSSSSCPPWVVGCRGYNPPPPPPPSLCSSRFAPWWCGHGGAGGDHDSHGCVASAGYQWCPEKGSCIRPWEESCGVLHPGPDHVKPVIPAHGTTPGIGGNPNSWTPTKKTNIGGSSATWTPMPKTGSNPATWTPMPKTGSNPATWTPMPKTGSNPATWTPMPKTGSNPATWTPPKNTNIGGASTWAPTQTAARPYKPTVVPKPVLPPSSMPFMPSAATASFSGVGNPKTAGAMLGTRL